MKEHSGRSFQFVINIKMLISIKTENPAVNYVQNSVVSSRTEPNKEQISFCALLLVHVRHNHHHPHHQNLYTESLCRTGKSFINIRAEDSKIRVVADTRVKQ